MTAALMIQGTGSDVGKSLIVAGLCRLFARRGLEVRPFKPQNMSNNAAIAGDGAEIGRAQALQARAAGVEPGPDMNPILLKPESGTGAQVIVRGQRVATMQAREFMRRRRDFMPAILESFASLSSGADLILVEGAGSPAEINLRDGDIANMGFADAADVPVALVGDIHRGGVIASIVGTFNVIPDRDAAMIKSFMINNFHGDPSLFDDGVAYLEENTNTRCAGIIPHFAEARKLPAEDALALEKTHEGGVGDAIIAVPRLARIANFDDLDPLRLEPGIDLRIIQPGQPLPGDADLVLLPGSKSTIADLLFLREQGWDVDIAAHVRRGGRVLGICGGYQMLGTVIRDPDEIEGSRNEIEGLGYLAVETVLTFNKALREVSGKHRPTGASIKGYEMHLGKTTGIDRDRPFAVVEGMAEGAINRSGRIAGTYLHGVFSSDGFRRAFLHHLDILPSDVIYENSVDETLDALAGHLEEHIDIDLLWSIADQRTRVIPGAA